MSRLPRGDRIIARGRPKRRAAVKANIFKYQLAADPSRAEENDLKRALQESLQEQHSSSNDKASRVIKGALTKGAKLDQQKRIKSTTSPEVTIVKTTPPAVKRTRLSGNTSNGHQQQINNKTKCDADPNSLITLNTLPSSAGHLHNRTIRTYSRSHQSDNNHFDSQQAYNNKNRSNKSQPPHSGLDSTSTTSNTTTIAPKSINSIDSRNTNGHQAKTKSLINQSSVSKSTQTPTCKPSVNITSSKSSSPNVSNTLDEESSASKNSSKTKDNSTNTNGIESHNQYLKSKRESKNYAYVKMTALKVSTEKFPSSHSRNIKKASPKGILDHCSANKDSLKASHQTARDISKGMHTNTSLSVSNSSKNGHEAKRLRQEEMASSLKLEDIMNDHSKLKGIKSIQDIGSASKKHLDESGIEYDCSPVEINLDLSNDRNHSQASVTVTQKRNPDGSWSLLGVPEEKVIYIRDDEPPRRLICYPAIKHVEGDVIQVRDSVLLRSGARKTDLPYIAKVCAFWEDAETGNVMMSLFWYYRPEHTEDGRKPHHLIDEIFASRHRDVDSVECIEDKCYVLTFNEYCRYRKRCKMEQVNSTWSLTDVTIPMSNESYPRRNRIPDSDVNPELVFCCRQVYDSRMKRLLKNPLINPKYGHI